MGFNLRHGRRIAAHPSAAPFDTRSDARRRRVLRPLAIWLPCARQSRRSTHIRCSATGNLSQTTQKSAASTASHAKDGVNYSCCGRESKTSRGCDIERVIFEHARLCSVKTDSGNLQLLGNRRHVGRNILATRCPRMGSFAILSSMADRPGLGGMRIRFHGNNFDHAAWVLFAAHQGSSGDGTL